jgi:hypothetical protein
MSPRLLALLLALPLIGHAASPQVLECRPDSGGWMDLLDGSSFGKVEKLAKARTDALDTRFTRYGKDSISDTESNHGVLVTYNDTGWLLVVRHDDAAPGRKPDGRFDIFLATDTPDAALPRAPHRLVLDLDDHGFTNRMAPNHMGAALGIEERNRRTGPAIVQERLLTEGYDYAPLQVAFKTFPRPEGGFYTTFFFAWGSFAEWLPAAERKGVEWRIKIVRTTPSDAQFVWGENPHLYAGYGTLRWPILRDDFLFHLYRQWLTTGYGNEYVDAKNRLHGLWTVAAREHDYGFLAVPEATFEPRNKTSDHLFYKTALVPLIRKNHKLAEAISKPKLSTKPFAVLSMPEPVRKLVFAELPRLRTFRHEVDALRRDFLLNCLLGRTPPLPPEPETKEPDVIEANWDSIEAQTGNVDIELDDVKF